jgi:hypothetical protein
MPALQSEVRHTIEKAKERVNVRSRKQKAEARRQ